jgi:hypothetical protein
MVADTPVPVAQPLSAEDIADWREYAVKQRDSTRLVVLQPDEFIAMLDRLDAARSVPDNAAPAAPASPAGLDVEIGAEVERARAKFGDQFDLTDGDWLAVITEEVGEAATETLRAKFFDPVGLLRRSTETGIPVDESDFPLARLRSEIVQVAAVARRWIAAIDHRVADLADDEP